MTQNSAYMYRFKNFKLNFMLGLGSERMNFGP